MDHGALQRYLLEMTWFPTAWLSDAVEWQVIDANSVMATIRQPGTVASATLHVNDPGQLVRLTAQRYRQEHGRYRLDHWTAECDEYKEVEGVFIPTRCEVTWNLDCEDFTWFRFKVTEIKYNQEG
ncbi:hypothetical protein V1506DRAFT_510267 [Lipomyces tetrasporus]